MTGRALAGLPALLFLAATALGQDGPPASADPGLSQPPTPFERADVGAVAEKLACYCGCPHMQVSTCFCGTADSIRGDIAAHLDAGGTAEGFIAAYVEEHGTWGLAVPPKEGFNLVVWALPGVLLAGGALLVFWLGARWARQPQPDRPVVEAGAATEAPSADREELERLLRESS